MSAGSGKSTISPVTMNKESITNNILTNSMKLTSFTLPRDLTLGGSGQPKIQHGIAKKVYTPNLNVVRNKNVNIEKSIKSLSFRGKGKSERGKSHQNARGGRGIRDGLVQTTSVFSEGVAARSLRKNYVSSTSSSRLDAIPDTLLKPTLIKRKTHQSDSGIDKQLLREILGDTGSEDFENENTDLRNIPVKLAQENEHTTLKQETCSEKYKITYPESLDGLLSKNESKLFLMQLPDSLPCQKLVDQESEPNKILQSGSTENYLRECEEGQIGRLLKYKSGKYRLVLGGNTCFDLDLGMNPGFLQEVISINTYREERSGNMINLGAVQAKITSIPDWKELFRKNI